MTRAISAGACPTLAELASFCWGKGSQTEREEIVNHLAACQACRGKAAFIIDGTRTDLPPRGR